MQSRDEAFKNAISLIQKYPNPHTAKVVEALAKIDETSNTATLYNILQNEKTMESFILCFREIAIHGLNTIQDENPQKNGLQWDDDSIGAFIWDSEDLQRATSAGNTPADRRRLYCEHQKEYGVDIQPPEIAALNLLICPISICGSLDVPNRMLHGFLQDYPEGRPITIFRWSNHYDSLIPK